MNKFLRAALIIVLAAVLIYSLTNIVLTEVDYKKADKIYEESRLQSFRVSERTTELAVSSTSEESFPAVTVDFEALKKTNSEVVGWLWIPETDINFPLLRAADNWKYLSLSYDLQHTNSGSIFMDYRNSAGLADSNTIIYGHNMKSGGMFGTLKKFADTAYFSEHPELYVITEERIYKYGIFAAYRTEADSKSYTRGLAGAFDYAAFVDYIKTCAGDTFSAPPTESGPIVTLSTCTSAHRSERFVVHSYLIASKRTD